MSKSQEDARRTQREYKKQRYHSDPAYRERVLLACRKQQDRIRENPEALKRRKEIAKKSRDKCYALKREEILASLKERYANDTEYREKEKTKARARSRIKLQDPEERKRVNARNRAWRKERYDNDPEFRRKQNAAVIESTRKRRKADPVLRMINGIGCTIRQAMVAGRTNKSNRVMTYIGCTAKELASYIESRFLDGMSWDNYGKATGRWVVDHIRPLASFDLSDAAAVSQAFHYSNLQPLWSDDNHKKGAKWEGKRYKRNGAISF